MAVTEKQYCSRKSVQLNNNQTGVTFEELFCKHFAGATEVTIYEPYIRQAYQFENLKVFVQLLNETQGINIVKLITTVSEGRNADYIFKVQIDSLEALKEFFDSIEIDFHYEFDNHLHLRRITCDKGKTIQSDRGLHIYYEQKNNEVMCSQDNRKCKQTDIEYIEQVDILDVISTYQGSQVKQDLEIESLSQLRSIEDVVREATTKYETKSKYIIVDNISENDRSKNKIRILVRNKFLFPREINGQHDTYLLAFSYNGIQYDAKYSIGSNDNRSRSGNLKLDRDLYKEIGIKAGVKLNIKLEDDGSYTIIKL